MQTQNALYDRRKADSPKISANSKSLCFLRSVISNLSISLGVAASGNEMAAKGAGGDVIYCRYNRKYLKT